MESFKYASSIKKTHFLFLYCLTGNSAIRATCFKIARATNNPTSFPTASNPFVTSRNRRGLYNEKISTDIGIYIGTLTAVAYAFGPIII